MAERPLVVAGTVLIMMTLAGCTTTQQGSATPTGPVGPRPSSYQAPTDGAGTISLPPRPADVPLTGADPCSLLTAAQQTTLGVGKGTKGLPAQLVNNSPTCNFRADNTLGAEYNVAVDTTEGIALYLNQNLADDVRQVSVGGFPALDITLKAPDLLQGCTTAVSVASGQMFVVNLGQPPTGTTTAQSCARTEQVADAVLATAKTRK
ncbi:MAG TPA: DUF3558 domain-containing protein [Pseudonocardiaceae bacterium]|nr:DUF3558 domain-containing protein [Pseudonocardiaceae bacterium]